MKICRKICEECHYDCHIFFTRKKFMVMCVDVNFRRDPYSPIQETFNNGYYALSDLYIHHVGDEFRDGTWKKFDLNDGHALFLYGDSGIDPLNDEKEYRYDGWNPFKRLKAFFSRMKSDYFWKTLWMCENDQRSTPEKFNCPYRMEHKLTEWNNDNED